MGFIERGEDIIISDREDSTLKYSIMLQLEKIYAL